MVSASHGSFQEVKPWFGRAMPCFLVFFGSQEWGKRGEWGRSNHNGDLALENWI